MKKSNRWSGEKKHKRRVPEKSLPQDGKVIKTLVETGKVVGDEKLFEDDH